MISPEFEPVRAKQLNTARLVPIYSETQGISSKWLRSRINDVLTGIRRVEEFLPESVIAKHKLMDISEAFMQIHFPKTAAEAEAAKTRFGVEELLLELLKVEIRKTEWQKTKTAVKINSADHQTRLTELVRSLPFALTPSQKRAVTAISQDMAAGHPMNRLLEGDVGTGKTVCGSPSMLSNVFKWL